MSSPKEFNGQLLRLREARRLADRDAQLLANRIALLEAEEAKAWKKIKQTKERAENILTLRQEHQQERQEVRRQVRLNRSSTRRKKPKQSYVDREVSQALHEKRRLKEQNRARKAARDMKAEQARLAKDRREQSNDIYKKNKARRDKIYKSRERARGRREQKKKEVLERNKAIYAEKVGKETMRRKKTEARVSFPYCSCVFCSIVSAHQSIIPSLFCTPYPQCPGIENGGN